MIPMSLHFDLVRHEANHQRNAAMAVPLILAPHDSLILHHDHHPHMHCSHDTPAADVADAADVVGTYHELHDPPDLFLAVIQNPVPEDLAFAVNGSAKGLMSCCCYYSAP